MTFEERALPAQQALFVRYDQLNERITKAEKRLTAFHIPHTVSYEYATTDERPENGGYTGIYIGVDKIKGEWRLCHGSAWYEDPEGPDFKPLVECSAVDRVNAVKHLGKLEAAILNASERFVSSVDRAVAELDKYLASST